MTFEELDKLKVGDTIYSFKDNKFYIYTVSNKSNYDITVRVEFENNVKDGCSYFIIEIPSHKDYNDPRYCYEFTSMSQDLNTAYQNYSNEINNKIRKLTGTRANLKGLKRQYMLNMNMIPEDEKNWKELGFKSKVEYLEYMNDMYADIRYGYVG